MTIMTNLPKTGVYRHFKGNLYELLYIATDSETLEKKVVYRALYGDGGIWVRPLSMWSEEVTLPDGTNTKRVTLAEEHAKYQTQTRAQPISIG